MSFNQEQTAQSDKAMVVSGHPLATEAALQVLRQGGSLADGAISGAAVLSTVLPHACGLGGDAFIIVHDAATGRTQGINASGPSPAAALASRFAGQPLPERGALSINVPGMVSGWELLHREYGRADWSELLQPAIALARDGAPVSPVLARATVQYHEMLARDPGCSTLFLDEGQPLQAGALWRQPALAESLSCIAQQGAKAFYGGDIAQRLGQASQAAGGLLRAEDLADYEAQWVEPLRVKFRGHEVRALPPNSFGLYLLLQLLALEQSPFPGIDQHAQRLARLVQAARVAFDVGAQAVADPLPQFGAESAQELLGEAGRQRLRSALGIAPSNLGGTAVISLADREGNAVTVIQSVYMVFGSGVADARTGALLNNRLFGFNQLPGHPNEVGPGKRPAHTLCPALVFADNELRYALATPGGPGQTLTLAQVLEGLLEGGNNLREAVDAPRWSMDVQGQAIAESTMPEAWVHALAELGVPLQPGAPGAPFFGSVKAIARQSDGRLMGVADRRRDATAGGL